MGKDLNIKVCLDARLVKPGDYFAPIVGEKFDGHTFIDQALQNGAIGVIEEEELYALAAHKLKTINPKIIGVTGSSGKTTTTNFLTQILSKTFIICKGDLNTKLGLSVNVINSMQQDCEVFVAEMGMDAAGELTKTTSLFPPDISIITTINETHAEKLGSVENILSAKTEIVKGMKTGGIALLNYDNNYLRNYGQTSNRTIKWFGLSHEAEFNPKNYDLTQIKVLGEHNISNLMACFGAASLLGMKKQAIEKASQDLTLPKGRLSVLEGINNTVLIDDSYNASPASTKAALKVLAEYPGKRKIAILGDMLELGQFEKQGHEEIAKALDELKIDQLIAVGTLGKIIYDNAAITKAHVNNSEVFDPARFEFAESDVILIKGSQGARMEKITKKLLANPEQAEELLVRQDARWK